MKGRKISNMHIEPMIN